MSLTIGLAVSARNGTSSGNTVAVCSTEGGCGSVGLGVSDGGNCDYVDEFLCVPGWKGGLVAQVS